MQTEHLVLYDRDFLGHYINFRNGEQKLGESIELPVLSDQWPAQLAESSARFVVVGAPEDLGVRANLGNPGAANAWESFLSAFLNVQSNRYLDGSEILLLGHLNYKPLLDEAEDAAPTDESRITKLRKLTAQADDWLTPVVAAISKAGKIPVVIGGGHNNAYSCIKGTSHGKGKAINVLNIDPHADFRELEGRHSGNGFSYARSQGFMGHFFVLGLHEGYNSEPMLQQMSNDEHVGWATFEELFVRNEKQLESVLKNLTNKWHEEFTGIEVDLDAIANMPASALTPSGLSVNEVRSILHSCGSRIAPAYYHFAEGAPTPHNQSEQIEVGKTISYLLQDVVKSLR